MFAVEIIGISSKDAQSVSCDDPDPGLLQTSDLSTGFAKCHYKYTSSVSSASLGLATI